MHTRVFGGELTNGLDGLNGVASRLFLPRRDGEREAVHQDVIDAHVPVVHQGVDEARGDTHLSLGGARLAFFVDGERDNRSAVLLHEWHDARETRVRPIAVLEVHRVDDGTAADKFHAGLKDSWLGGVDDQRKRGCAGKPGHDLAHIANPVTTHIVDADVEHVGSVADLIARNVDAVIPTFLEHGITKRPRSVGVGAFSDGEEGVVLNKGNVLIQACHTVFMHGSARHGRGPSQSINNSLEVRGGGAAATAHKR